MHRLTRSGSTKALITVLFAAVVTAAVALSTAPFLAAAGQSDELTASLSRASAICKTPAPEPAGPADQSTP
jgi:hypothetical protein